MVKGVNKMKKRNRVLAGVLAVLLVLTSFTWPSSNTMVASADDSSSGAAAQSTPYKKSSIILEMWM